MTQHLFWGPLFPDAEQHEHAVDAIAAELALADVTAPGGALQFARIRARTAGAAGNTIRVTFGHDALTEGGELHEDTVARTVRVDFVSGGTTVDDVAALLLGSELVTLVGIWQPHDGLRAGDDEFTLQPLSGGADAHTETSRFWGPLFPDAPEASPPVPGAPAEATFALQIETGGQVTYNWRGSITKTYDAREQRSSAIDLPRASYTGSAYLLDGQTALARDRLQKVAASGAAFALALPHEEVNVEGPAEGAFVPVSSLEFSDWASPGATVVLFRPDGGAEEFVVQSVPGGGGHHVPLRTLELDREPADCFEGCVIAPCVRVYLSAQQGFRRYPADPGGAHEAVEEWQIDAVGADLGFPVPAVPARLALGDPLTFGTALQPLTLVARQPGPDGNSISVQALNDGTGVTVDDSGTGPVVIHFQPGVTTSQDFFDAVNAHSVQVRAAGTPTSELMILGEEFGPVDLAGGADEAPGTFGRGSTLTTWEDGRPIWDRGIDLEDDSVGDAAHAMTDILDLGGKPVSFGVANRPDYGRQMRCVGEVGEESQHCKAFAFAARGTAHTFYLPTFRPDFLAFGGGPGGSGAGSLALDSGYSDFFAWFPPPAGAALILVQQGEEQFVLEVVEALDEGEGLVNLVVRAAGDGPLPSTDPIDRVSLVELCRFERGEHVFEWAGSVFTWAPLARAVQR